MKKLLFLIFVPSLVWAQNISIDPRSITNANIELKRAVMANRNIKGSPYLDDEFSTTTLEFKEGKQFEGAMRYNMYKDLFELKSAIDDVIYELKLTDGMKATHLGRNFSAHYLRSENKVATFEVLVDPSPYGLYLFHRKTVQNNENQGIAFPSSNQANNQDASWKDESFMVLINGNEVFQLSKSQKKLLDSGIVDKELYMRVTKKIKYKLTKTEDVTSLVLELNKNL